MIGGIKIEMKKKRQFTVIIEEGEDGYLIGTAEIVGIQKVAV